jgi:hypothetical protein
MRVTKVGISVIVVAAIGLGVAAVMNQREPPPLQTPEALEQQAAAITAHRQNQRDQSPPAVAAPFAESAPTSTLPVPRSTSVYWTDFRGPLRDGAYRQQPIRAN